MELSYEQFSPPNEDRAEIWFIFYVDCVYKRTPEDFVWSSGFGQNRRFQQS